MADIAALHESIMARDATFVQLLLDSGIVDVNEVLRHETAFTRATLSLEAPLLADSSKEAERCLEAILTCPHFNPNAPNQRGRTPLHAAVHADRYDLVQRLLVMGADPNILTLRGVSPLASCASVDNDKIARLLIQHGASLTQKTPEGLNPLHRACSSGAVKMATALLNLGCDVQTRCNKGETPLMAATTFKYHCDHGRKKLADLLDLCQALIDAGCDVNAQNLRDQTALHDVVDSNNIYGICLLAENGADLSIKNCKGHTAFDIATKPGSTKYEAALILLHYGANPCLGREGVSREGCPLMRVMTGMYINVENPENLNSRRLLLQALCEAIYPKAVLHNLDEQITPPSSDALRSTLAGQRLEEVELNAVTWLERASVLPCSLQHQARLCIRRSLGRVNILNKIERLPVALKMKRYINLGQPVEDSKLYTTVRLHAAIRNNVVDKVKSCLASGVNPHLSIDGISALSLSCRHASSEIIDLVLKHILPLDTRMAAISVSGPSSSKTPSTSRPKPSETFKPSSQYRRPPDPPVTPSGDTILHTVAKYGKTDQVTTILRVFGAHMLEIRNSAGFTATAEAIRHGKFLTAQAMLLIDSRWSDEDNGSSPSYLHLAVACGAENIVRMLLESGLDPNCPDKYGLLPMQLAGSGGRQYLEAGMSLPALYHSELEENLDEVCMRVHGLEARMTLDTDRHRRIANCLLEFGGSADQYAFEFDDNDSDEASFVVLDGEDLETSRARAVASASARSRRRRYSGQNSGMFD